jgi:pyruvate ferredoxin oxidoreductase delta subunit
MMKSKQDNKKEKKQDKPKTPAAKKGWKEIPIGTLVLEPGSSLNYKTGDWRTFRPETDFNKCIHCMICWVNCPDSSIIVKDGKKISTNLDFCKGCGICADECPVKCIQMVEESKYRK